MSVFLAKRCLDGMLIAVTNIWNILDAGLARSNTGHNYWETKAVVEELTNRGVDVRLFCDKNDPIDQFSNACVQPTFSLNFYTNVSEDPSWGVLENFVVHNRAFERDLSQLSKSFFHEALAFFPTISQRQFLAIVRWLAQFDDVIRPKTVVTLLPLPDWSPERPFARFAKKIWADCPSKIKLDLALTVRTDEVASQFHQLLGLRPHVLPSPLGAHNRRAKITASTTERSPGPLLVSFLGGARLEKGAGLIPEIVKLCQPLNVRFFIQAKREAETGAHVALTELRGIANVELHEGVLESDAFHSVIAESIVLIPYGPNEYRWRSSGIFTEAKFLGAPVIVSAGSWMAEEVRRIGNGLVSDEDTPASIAACIAQAAGEIGKLRKNAAICAGEFSRKNGPDRFVDAIETLIESGHVN
jgi:hypothetical protein